MKPFKLFSIFALLVLFANCKKDDVAVKQTDPVLKINAVSNADITFTSAKVSGQISLDKNETVTTRGLVYGKATAPTIDGTKTVETADSFTASVTGLDVDTKYYVRAYATTATKTYYSDEATFSTHTLSGTTWDFLMIHTTDITWHADVTFNADGTTLYDEPDYPGMYLNHGTWSVTGNTLTYKLDAASTNGAYIYTGTLVENNLSGTYTYDTPRQFTAVLK